jgi:hypothetical protein
LILDLFLRLLVVTVAASILLLDINAVQNFATCFGLDCGAQGGFVQIQNGPAISVGQVAKLKATITNLTASHNQVQAFPPLSEYTSVICNPDIASCNSPSFGGAVSVMSLNGEVQLKGSNWTSFANSASCVVSQSNSDGCLAFGGTLGISKETIVSSGAYLAELDVSILSSRFECGNASCSGPSCTALSDVWSTQYGTSDSVPSLYIGGDQCTFTGNAPPSGNGEVVSAVCDLHRANDTAVCGNVIVRNDDDHQPGPIPMNDDDGGSSSSLLLPVGAIIGIAVGGGALLILVALYFWRLSILTQLDDSAIGLRSSSAPHAQPDAGNPLHHPSSLRDGLL